MQAVWTWVAGVPWAVLWALLACDLLLLVVGAAGRVQLAQLAIMTAFKAGRQLVAEGLAGVSDAQLAQIAHAAYATLPSVWMLGPVPLPLGVLKVLISEAAFAALVEREYRAFAAYYQKAMAGSGAKGSQPNARWLPGESPVALQVAQVRAQAQTQQPTGGTVRQGQRGA